MVIGAGRATKEDEIDHAVGILLKKKVGDLVKKGDLIAEIHYNDDKHIEQSRTMILDAYVIGSKEQKGKRNILEIIE